MSSEDDSYEEYVRWKRQRAGRAPVEALDAPKSKPAVRQVEAVKPLPPPAAVVPVAVVAATPIVVATRPPVVPQPIQPPQAVVVPSVVATAPPVAVATVAPVRVQETVAVAKPPSPQKQEATTAPDTDVSAARKDDTSEDSADTKDNTKGKDEAGSTAPPPAAKTSTTAAPEQLWLAEMSADNERILVDSTFDGKAWTNAFRQAKRENDEARVSYLRRVVQQGTNKVLVAKAYEKDGHSVALADTVESVKRTTFYDGKVAFGSFNRYHQTTAHFVKADAVDVALFLMDKKSVNPVVLVMADEKKPGGSYMQGTCAQEESIYRRTTLKLNLEDPDGVAKDREWKYEIPPFGGIYAPDVQVFRSSEGRGYEFLPQPKKLAFICVSSLVSPQLETNKKTQQQMLNDDDAKVTQRKIETILNIGLQNGHDAIVLSAFGCGYNKNPPHHIAKLFREVITTQFPACYRHVTFAILDDENTRLEHNPEGNIKPFQDEFLNVSSRVASKKCVIV